MTEHKYDESEEFWNRLQELKPGDYITTPFKNYEELPKRLKDLLQANDGQVNRAAAQQFMSTLALTTMYGRELSTLSTTRALVTGQLSWTAAGLTGGGAIAGAYAGATIGSASGPIGTGVGCVIGGIVGGIVGTMTGAAMEGRPMEFEIHIKDGKIIIKVM